jgi:MFS family permease
MHGGPVLEGGWPAFREQLAEIMAVPTLRRIFVGLFTLFVGINGIMFWLPTFFDRAHDTGTGLGGTYSAIIGLFGIVGGAVIGGALGDRWHGSRPAARIVLGDSGLVGGSLVLGLPLLDLPLFGRIVLLTVALLLLAISIPNLMAAVTDVCPIHVRGAGFALLQLFLAVGASGGPLAVGAVSGAVCAYAISWKFKFKYDDALDVVGIHMVGGIIGCLALGFLASSAVPGGGDNGLFYGGGVGLLAAQAISVIGVMVYTFIVTFIIAKVIDLLIGFRIAEEVETNGLDHELHAESAYAFDELDELEEEAVSSSTPPGGETASSQAKA